MITAGFCCLASKSRIGAVALLEIHRLVTTHWRGICVGISLPVPLCYCCSAAAPMCRPWQCNTEWACRCRTAFLYRNGCRCFFFLVAASSTKHRVNQSTTACWAESTTRYCVSWSLCSPKTAVSTRSDASVSSNGLVHASQPFMSLLLFFSIWLSLLFYNTSLLYSHLTKFSSLL